MLAASAPNKEAVNQVHFILVGGRTTLIKLYELLKQNLISLYLYLKNAHAVYREFRAGDL